MIAEGAAPIPAERTAARELADFLGKVTGAEFPIVPEDKVPEGSRAIYVGRTAFAAAQGIDLSTFDPKEWLIRPVGDDLILAGGRNAGTGFAVFEFLEKYVGVQSPVSVHHRDSKSANLLEMSPISKEYWHIDMPNSRCSEHRPILEATLTRLLRPNVAL